VDGFAGLDAIEHRPRGYEDVRERTQAFIVVRNLISINGKYKCAEGPASSRVWLQTKVIIPDSRSILEVAVGLKAVGALRRITSLAIKS
jgi:hypothetical protein